MGFVERGERGNDAFFPLYAGRGVQNTLVMEREPGGEVSSGRDERNNVIT
jgi:hypothetical protein